MLGYPCIRVLILWVLRQVASWTLGGRAGEMDGDVMQDMSVASWQQATVRVGRSRGSVMDELRESTEPDPVAEPEGWPDDDWSDL